MKQITIGILAHVDAGKTTLSESLLYDAGAIRTMGRVDKRDAFLDTNVMERERGITIFSKQAVFEYEDICFTLLDTPGHVDFSPEAERTLWVLDAAILLVSAPDGVQGHTKTLFSLLQRHGVPVFIFVNKMDQPGMDRTTVLANLKVELSDSCIDFEKCGSDEFYEEVALGDEDLMERYLEGAEISDTDIAELIKSNNIFPVLYGSALKNEGVEGILKLVSKVMSTESEVTKNRGLGDIKNIMSPKPSLGVRVFKITRDEEGNRLTHVKVTGGTLANRQVLCDDEKITQIRVYNGVKYTTVTETEKGGVYALLGLTKTYGGQGIGIEADALKAQIEPVMTYKVIHPAEVDPGEMMKKLSILCEDLPELRAIWDEELREIQISVMGEVQLEILTRLIKDRFDIEVSFGAGKIVYKETIADIVEGVGHFEPLRHYAEVHLKIESAERGSGVQVFSDVSQDELALNWQRLIETHVLERSHRGVLTGSLLTDVKISIIGGRAHNKHTVGGDFRQATYRAIRQGLMQAECVLLEPYYNFILTVPDAYVGRAMTDLDMRKAHFEGPVMDGSGSSTFTGYAPVSVMQDYPAKVVAYSGGMGSLSVTYRGYEPCMNPEEIIAERGYVPEADVRNTPDSVFCAHGAAVIVPWNEVFDHMHVPKKLSITEDGVSRIEVDEAQELMNAAVRAQSAAEDRRAYSMNLAMGYEEVDDIVAKAGSANIKSSKRENVPGWKREKRSGAYDGAVTKQTRVYKAPPKRDKYMLVDGYNVIYAWKKLAEAAGDNLDSARISLLEILSNYRGMDEREMIVVFDAYRVKGQVREMEDYHNIHVVYTKEAETADAYIERYTHENGKKYDITVVTSDGLEQVIILGNGCSLLSAREFETEVERQNREIRLEHTEKVQSVGNKLIDNLSGEGRRLLDSQLRQEQ